MTGAPFRFTVPFLPPSVNHYKGARKNGGFYRKREAVAFVDAVCVISRKTMVTGNFYTVEIFFFLGPSKRNLSSNDLDNFQKVGIDALVRAGVIKTDGRILDLNLHKRFVATDREEGTLYLITGQQLDESKILSGKPYALEETA